MSLKINMFYLLMIQFVRGNTSQQIIAMAKKSGAKKVSMVSTAPPVRHPNVYGIDMPTHDELVAHNIDVDEIAQKIGVDHLYYQDLNDLIDAVQNLNPSIKQFECSVFDGNYISGKIDQKYFDKLKKQP